MRTFYFVVIEVSSGEYGDVVPMLVKAWNAYVAENMSRGSSTSSNTNSNFKQMMVSILPCTMKSENKNIFGGVSQLSQVSCFLYKCVLVHEMWKSVQYIIEYREIFSCKGLSLEYTNHFDTSFSISRFLENFLVLFYNFYYKIFKYQSINSWLRWKSIIGAFL